ncbi:hypothetical protein NST08_21170 [Paenibacillus sp. FSL K6-1566]|uniref:hypothetical protein n=1 Tax=Paenibacillus TaxID=44249 RepID=UPI0020403C87|nr:hypothetical protein [Paenibacillus lactis]MCM3497578.1 hypothetical protein [Paenibacillus lactis]
MSLNQKNGAALGLLAGTTFGSGIGFLLGWHSYDLVGSVAAGGILGIAGGIWLSCRILFKELP